MKKEISIKASKSLDLHINYFKETTYRNNKLKFARLAPQLSWL